MIKLSTKVNIKNIGLKINRFWSSPKELPFVNIVTVVLSRPTIEDIKRLIDKFGIDSVKSAYKFSLEKGEFSQGEIKYANRYINEIEKEHNA